MNQLNKDIRELEMNLLDRKNEENVMKKKLELFKLNEKNKLNSMDKKFSNEQKRDAYVDNLDEVKEMSKQLFDYQYNTQIMEIELRFKLRNFDILKSELVRGMI